MSDPVSLLSSIFRHLRAGNYLNVLKFTALAPDTKSAGSELPSVAQVMLALGSQSGSICFRSVVVLLVLIL